MNVRSILLMSVLLAGCHAVSPDAGQEAVLVSKPFWPGSKGGVLAEPVQTGLTYVALTTSAVMINMWPELHTSDFRDLMTSDGVPLEFNAVIRTQVIDPVALVKDFGANDWYRANVEPEFFNAVRTAVKKHGMNETAIQTSAIEEIDAEVSQAMMDYFKVTRLPVKLIKVTVGKANPPDAIKSQRIETAAQEQRVLTLQKANLAEQARKASETSRAEADKAYLSAVNLSPAMFVELERIKMLKEVCEVPGAKCTFFVGGDPKSVVPAQ